MIDRDLAFPILAFEASDNLWGYRTLERFTICTALDLKYRVGMLLIGADGRAFRVTGITKIPRRGSLFRRLSDAAFGVWRISHGLSEEPAIPFETLQRRVCDSITANPDYWRDDEAIAGEDGPPVEEEVLLEALREKVRKSRSVAEIIAKLELAD